MAPLWLWARPPGQALLPHPLREPRLRDLRHPIAWEVGLAGQKRGDIIQLRQLCWVGCTSMTNQEKMPNNISF